eukprot:TRINITY_DN6268_c0_g1_i1.p1 TRINITY_DN6268_c0_g1~~TRINITY_DN6268_c0_g1_i1.p1  ORF type:complete len:471 (+),score=151.22 TRINITY_DN6268_c0_g1_i1:3-1415(+)
MLSVLDAKGRTPLHIAAHLGEAPATTFLVQSKSDPAAADYDGMTPLHLAILAGHDDVCHVLCTSGADVSLRYALRPAKRVPRPTLGDDASIASSATSSMRSNNVRKATESARDHDRDDSTSVASSNDTPEPEPAITKADRYGHIIDTAKASPSPESAFADTRAALKLELERSTKWAKMMKKWDTVKAKKGEVLRRRVYKGIPDCVRGEAWKRLAAVDEPGPPSMLPQFKELQGGKTKWSTQIDLDVNRSSRNHIMFRERYGEGQASLFAVLKAYAVGDQELGYCQGMSDITALLLMYMQASDAFELLEHLMVGPKFNMRAIMLPGFPRLNQAFYVHEQLLRKSMPSLSKHFVSTNLLPAFYATKWFMMAFLDIFSFRVTLRIWDVLMHDGYDVVFTIALAVLKMHEATLLAMSFDKMMEMLREFETMPIDPDKLMSLVEKMKVPSKKIRKLEAAYNDAQTRKPPPQTKAR